MTVTVRVEVDGHPVDVVFDADPDPAELEAATAIIRTARAFTTAHLHETRTTGRLCK